MRYKLMLLASIFALGVQMAPLLKPARATPSAYNVTWLHFGDQAGGMASGASYRVNASTGQAVAGSVASANYRLCTGVQCLPRASVDAYLPAVTR